MAQVEELFSALDVAGQYSKTNWDKTAMRSRAITGLYQKGNPSNFKATLC
jgi:hypothetical protein